MTTIATGIYKKLHYKKETTWGTAATGGAATGQALRRVESTLDLKKQTYQSKEIRTDQQVSDFRHGVRTVDGSINGELSVGTYADFMASICRNTWSAVVAPAAYSSGLLTSVATGSPSGTTGTITRSGGSFITDGFRVGDVVRFSGWTTTGTNLNNRNVWIIALTATVMTVMCLDGTLIPGKAGETGAVTCVTAGKKTSMATANHVNDSYSIEHWHSDITESELFVGCRVADMDLKLPASGMAGIDISFLGKDVQTQSGTAYFTSPTAATTGGVLAAVNGLLAIDGTPVALVTGMNMKITGNVSTGEVVGSNSTPDVFVGRMEVSGQLTVYFTDTTMRDMFINETEASLQCAFTSANSATADFIAFTLPRIKVGGASKDDGEKGLSMTMPYVALLNAAGGATVNSTLTIMDSLAA